MSNRLKHLLSGILALLLLVIAFGGGIFVGLSRTPSVENSRDSVSPAGVNFAPFWKAWKILDDKFVDSHATTTAASTTEKRVWGAIGGMAEALGDPYTTFLPPEEKKGFEENINGNFGGVGMEIDVKNRILTVVSAFKNTPAKKAGIKPGDQILKIDNRETGSLTLTEAVKLIRGEIGTAVTITVRRLGESDQPIRIIRAKIFIPILDTETRDGVFIIRLYNFNTNAANAFRAALREFIGAKTDKLIIDLRGNPGGLLDVAVDMASWFLPAGKPVVIERRRAKEEDKIYRSYGYDVFTDQLKLAILIDGGSASASEILAGALSEYGIGTLVGEKSFGKGSVQELVEVTPDSSLKITVAKWLTPKLKSLVDNGLEPDLFAEAATTTPASAGFDPVLLRAIDFLKHEK